MCLEWDEKAERIYCSLSFIGYTFSFKEEVPAKWLQISELLVSDRDHVVGFLSQKTSDIMSFP